MDGVELTRLMKGLLQLLQNISDEGELKSEDEIAIRVDRLSNNYLTTNR